MTKQLSTPTADSVYYQVFDGQYVSDLFESLDEAKADADTCARDENFSGEAEVVRYELCNSGSAGMIVYRKANRYYTGRTIKVPTPRHSYAVRDLYVEHSDRLNAAV